MYIHPNIDIIPKIIDESIDKSYVSIIFIDFIDSSFSLFFKSNFIIVKIIVQIKGMIESARKEYRNL